MNSAITITLALTTICCFANGVVAVGDVVQDLSELKAEFDNFYEIVNTTIRKFVMTGDPYIYESDKVGHPQIDLANSSVLAYATAARKNGKKVNETCQPDFENEMKNIMNSKSEFTADGCFNSEMSRLETITTSYEYFNVQLKPLMRDIQYALKAYDELKKFIDTNVLGRDDKNTTLTERTWKCYDDKKNYTEERIKSMEEKANDCIHNAGGTIQGLSREPST